MTTSSAANSPDSALGYLYQIHVALLGLLRRARVGAEFVVSFETDDVAFESHQPIGATPDELLQTKHHQKAEASLSDASENLGSRCGCSSTGYPNSASPLGTTLHWRTTGCHRCVAATREGRRLSD